MNIDSAFPSKWLKYSDIPETGDLVLTIKAVEMSEVGQGNEVETKPVIAFSEITRGLVLNKTNANTIKGLYGNETNDWVGKRIALFATETEMAGKQVMAIRVRMKAPVAQTEAQRWTTTMQSIGATAADIRASLGTEKVSEWLKSNPEKTIEDAAELVRQTMADFSRNF